MDVNLMNGPELRDRYNEMADRLGLSHVEKFRTLEAGRKRVAALEAQLGQVNGNGQDHEVVSVSVDDKDPPEFLKEDNLAVDATPTNRSCGVPNPDAEVRPNPNASIQAEFGSPALEAPSERGTETMADGEKKARKPRAKKAKPEAAESAEPRAPIQEEFGTRPGSIRALLLELLSDDMGKGFTMPEISKALYDGDAERVGASSGVLKGIQIMIDAGKLPYKIEKGKNEEKVTTFALVQTDQ